MTPQDIFSIAVALAALIFIIYIGYRWVYPWAVWAIRACFAVWFGCGVVVLAWEYGRPVVRELIDRGQIALPFLEEQVRNL